jgi:hypothetical protein
MQNIIQIIKSLLEDETVKTAAELLKTLGVIGGTGLSLLAFWNSADAGQRFIRRCNP